MKVTTLCSEQQLPGVCGEYCQLWEQAALLLSFLLLF